MMFFRHILLFFMLVEIFTTFVVIDEIGFFNAFCLWLLSAFIGVLVIQRQGMEMLMHAQGMFNRNTVPVDNIIDGLRLVFAGLLFLMPGFISDIIGFCLLFPYTKKLFQNRTPSTHHTHTARPMRDDDVIDGSYVRVEETVDVIEQDRDKN